MGTQSTMTRSQKAAIDYIKKFLLIAYFNNDIDEGEIKKFEVTQEDNRVYVRTEIIFKDSGYTAEKRYIKIGPKGGFALLNAKNKDEKYGGWNSVHAPVRD